LIGLAGCSGPRLAQDDVASEKVLNEVHYILPREEVSSVIASGFYAVSERALQPITVRELGIEGIRGLATIDPEIRVEVEDSILSLYYGEERVKTIVAPREEDSESWADAVYESITALWPFSQDLAATQTERVYEAVFDAALSHLDIFSRYAGRAQAREHRERREGYGGVDMTLKKIDERIFVDSVRKSGPAYKSGVRAGDMLIRVDGHPVIGKSVHEVTSWLHGKIQSELSLEIERPLTGVTQKVFVWRDLIVPSTITSSFNDGVLDIRISSFNDSTFDDVAEDLKKTALMYDKRFKGVVLDLRANPGGLLKRAVQVADLFLAGGRIISTQGRHPDSFSLYDADPIDLSQGRPLVVLLNANSASASEIVAAALQDRKRAVIIGSSSYGKGTVQSVQRLPNDGEITITWSWLIAPSGYAFHGLGVRPAICTSGVADGDSARAPALWENDGRDLMHHWRTVGIDERKERKKLRSSCPPDRHVKGIDLEIARNVIMDPSLFKRYTSATTLATVVP
jgi:carboxyl-terminal processing protease